MEGNAHAQTVPGATADSVTLAAGSELPVARSRVGTGSDRVFLTDRLREHAATRGANRAVVCDGRTLTYAKLLAQSERCAAAIQSSGFAAGGERRIGLIAANGLDFVTVIVAAQLAGVTVVPLPGPIASDAHARMIDDAKVRFLFYDADHEAKAMAAVSNLVETQRPKLIPIGPTRDAPDHDRLADWFDERDHPFAPVALSDDWQADLIYSSGTTGMPKGIGQSYIGRAAQSVGLAQLGVDASTNFAMTVGLYSNLGMVGLQLSLWWGGTFFVNAKFSADALVDVLARETITMAWFAPATLLRTVDADGFDDAVRNKPAVKLAAGAAFSHTLKQQVLDRWPGPLWDLYGQTETGTITLLPLHDVPMEKRGSIGLPLATAEVRIIDEHGQALPTGSEGEMVARTDSMMIGYHQRADATASAYWIDEQGREFVRTGDIGRVDEDGFVWLCDRKKDLIISGGFNIYPADLEGVLQAHEGVFEAAVVGCPSTKWGETPVGFVTLRSGAAVDEEELRLWANARLGSIQKIAAVRILPELPNGTLGKVLKRELRDRFALSLGTLP